MNRKSWVLVFIEPLFNDCSVPISIVTIYFEAPGRQVWNLSDSLFSIFLENGKQMAWGQSEWSWILIGRGYRMSKDWMGWVCSLLSSGEDLTLILTWPRINFWSGKETDLPWPENTLDSRTESWFTTTKGCHLASLGIVSLPVKQGH